MHNQVDKLFKGYQDSIDPKTKDILVETLYDQLKNKNGKELDIHFGYVIIITALAYCFLVLFGSFIGYIFGTWKIAAWIIGPAATIILPVAVIFINRKAESLGIDSKSTKSLKRLNHLD